jgi:hypothetical protein
MHVCDSEFATVLHAILKVLQLAQQLLSEVCGRPLLQLSYEPRLTQQTKATGDARDWSVFFHLSGRAVLYCSVVLVLI